MSEAYCSNQISGLATNIWQDINSPSSISVGYISGWLTTTGGMIGGLNNRLGTCVYVSGDAPCLVDFDPQLGSIASLIYQAGYYRSQFMSALNGGGTNQILWTSMAEGDSKVSRVSMVDVAKQWRELYVETEKQLNKQIHYWTLNQTVPQAINATQLYAYPSP